MCLWHCLLNYAFLLLLCNCIKYFMFWGPLHRSTKETCNHLWIQNLGCMGPSAVFSGAENFLHIFCCVSAETLRDAVTTAKTTVTHSLSHSSLFTVRRLCLSVCLSLSLSPIFLLLFKFLSFCPHLCLSRSHSSVSISFLFLYLNILSFYLSLSILCVCSCPVLSLYLSLFLSFENCFEHWIHRVMLNCFRLMLCLFVRL